MLRLGVQTAAELPPKQYALEKVKPRRTRASRLGDLAMGLPSAAIESARISSASSKMTFGFFGSAGKADAAGRRSISTVRSGFMVTILLRSRDPTGARVMRASHVLAT